MIVRVMKVDSVADNEVVFYGCERLKDTAGGEGEVCLCTLGTIVLMYGPIGGEED